MSYFSKVKEANIFSRYLVVFIVLELLSYIAWAYPHTAWVFLLMIAIVTLYLLLRNSIFFLLIPLAEIFWGSLGHSFDYQFINTRLLIFILVVLVFAIKNINKINSLKLFRDKNLFRVYLFLWLTIILAFIIGYFNNNFNKVFLDANAYIYMAYLPIWYQVYDQKYLEDIFSILKAATLVIAVKTILLLNVFSQNYSFLNLENIYKWVRDTRTGEITPFKDSFFRIFMQSQFYLILAWFLAFFKMTKDFFNKNNLVFISLLSAALYISLSRSFWLAMIIGILFFLINLFIYQHRKISLYVILSLISVLISSILIVEVFYNLPSFKNINIFTQRSTDTSEAALNTRSQLWSPMWTTIFEKPFFGHGYGTEITYQSSDPRIKNENNPDGWHTTYAFEWGWMDQLVKGGVGLILAFIFWAVLLYNRLYRKLRDNPIISLLLSTALTTLLIIHIFTPYINHPLGLSLFMLISIITTPYGKSYSYH